MGLLDISGFFTGLIINLLLITLVCYYFKRKYENIESAQMEQAKLLYELLKKSNEPTQVIKEETYESDSESMESLSDDETVEDQNDLITELKEVHIDSDTDYNKLSVKSLRDLLSSKGIKTTNKMKKNELISLATNKKSLVVDLAFDEPLELNELEE
jgi:predicted acyltransferase (DUF342 family)